MSRTKSYTRDTLTQAAMMQFWHHGFYATSIADLVAVTGVSKHGLYAEFGDKRGMFAAAMEHYFEAVVTPAFSRVEAEGAGLAEISEYFEAQISLAEQGGLPGPGCLVANTMVESGPHDGTFEQFVQRHLNRLTTGFDNALRGEAMRRPPNAKFNIPAEARFLTVASQGLWSVSRTTRDGDELRSFVTRLLTPLEQVFSP
mgnify:CR=1 FL=1